MYSCVLYYNIEKSGFNAVSAYLLFFFQGVYDSAQCETSVFWEQWKVWGSR